MSSGRMREVIVAQSVSPRWKEIIVNTGMYQSDAQFKVSHLQKIHLLKNGIVTTIHMFFLCLF